ncbi:hypothetical protein F4781DRAFT_424060 [Annulohypoxylon bovei var. microspora]|nr:hypothetical protein F4781DRAFT_424060 [Annulohypoxylon bovei var. microspora]
MFKTAPIVIGFDLAMKLVYIIYIQIIARSILASLTFQPNCTIPPESTNLVLAANVRGTLDILWTSLFTLLTCCWTVQHLNRAKATWRAKVKYIFEIVQYDFQGILPKCKWMLLTLFMPEFLVGKALQDRRLAKASVTEMENLSENLCSGFEWVKKKWTMTHGFYANMGGFAIKAKSLVDGKMTITPVMQDIPEITEEEIKDKSKSDFFIKTITIGQLLWFIIQAITRGIRGLAISQLEIAVLAYAACAIITFFLCLSKPKDVRVPTMLLVKESTEPQLLDFYDRTELFRLHPVSWFRITLRSHRCSSLTTRPSRTETILSPIPNDARYSHKAAMSMVFPGQALLTCMDDGFIIAGMVFGAIHCASWYSDFPTTIEQLLWQIASVFTACLLPVYYSLLLIDIHVGWRPVLGYILPFFEFFAVLGYIMARLYLVVEIFRSLCFQPYSAFVTTWSSEIPHVS